ncbi:ribonuclease P protein component [Balneola sp. MJW-20]|uniref:ribonuclease P protein component n=1 Tax=Gracilimonas aurantiaca TaxID=3234185 RepID=UPI003467E0B4
MKRKELSNASASDQGNFTLPKSKILRGKRNLQNIFSDSTVLSTDSLNLRFATYDNATPSWRVGFISPKRTGNAVKRNRMKRLMREAFRQQRSIVDEIMKCNTADLHLILMSRTTDIPYQTVFQDVATLLDDMRSRLCPNQTS